MAKRLTLNKTWVILSAALLAGAAFFVFDRYREPAGVAAMGDGTETIAWIALATAIVSMITAIIGLVQKILEIRTR